MKEGRRLLSWTVAIVPEGQMIIARDVSPGIKGNIRI
jgi:hypothetical protein